MRFVTAACRVHALIEARDDKRLLRLQRQLAKVKRLIIDPWGFVLLRKTGAERLFEPVLQHDERAPTRITSTLPFEECTQAFGGTIM